MSVLHMERDLHLKMDNYKVCLNKKGKVRYVINVDEKLFYKKYQAGDFIGEVEAETEEQAVEMVKEEWKKRINQGTTLFEKK